MDPAALQDTLDSLITTLRATLRTELTSVWLPIQFGAIALAALAGWGAATAIRRRFDLVAVTMGWPPYLRIIVRALIDNAGVLLFIVFVGLARAAIRTWAAHPRTYILGVAADLATAWVVIALMASLIRNPFINRLVSVVAWTVAALNIMGLLDATVAALDSRAVIFGGLRITLLLVIKTSVLLLIALWAAAAVSSFLDRRVHAVTDLTPSLQALIGKLIHIAIMTLAVIVVLSSVGIDLSVLAVFGGAVGVGIGFGLQKIVSNFVSGIILLADKSIKPGDVISVGERFGWVTHMGARCTSVDTRDGREILIPNEDFVTQQVVNWSYSNNRMMLQADFGVSYDSDPHRVIEIATAAAASVTRVIDTPAPACFFVAFGESSLDFSLRYWIADTSNGIINMRGTVMLALWDAFKREGIEIPYPVRDLRFGSEARVRLQDAK